MPGLLSYSGMSAKVRAMTGRLIKKEEYEEMAELNSVTEVAEYLGRYPSYRNLFAGDENGVHRIEMEEAIYATLFRDFHRLYQFAGLEQRKFLKIYYLRFENTLLKRYLRQIFEGRPRPLFEQQEDIRFFEEHSAFDIQLLSQARSTEAFREALKGTVLYSVLKGIEAEGTPTLFEYENALNLYLMKKMIQEYKKVLKKKDLNAIAGIYGMEIDLLNIQWIYRAKRYYRMEAADIQSILIPLHYKLNEEIIKQFIEAGDMEELIHLVSRSYYARYLEEDMADISIESLYRKVIEKIRSLNMLKYPYSAACMENYLYRKETETDKLTTLVEGVRFGIGAQEIQSYIE